MFLHLCSFQIVGFMHVTRLAEQRLLITEAGGGMLMLLRLLE